MDTETYRQTVLANKDRVLGYAARLLADREDARDVAQEALVRLWEHRDQVEDGMARAWLLRTTHNLCFDRLRMRSTRRPADVAELESLSSPAAAPESALRRRETARLLEEVLASLAARDRAVLLLREVEGLSYEEIGEVLGIPVGTLKAVLHRARERARERLVARGVRP